MWEHAGIICTGETYKNAVKMTFANASLEGKVRRAIDFHVGGKIDEEALKALIGAAVALNMQVAAAAGPVRSHKRPKSA